MTTTINVTLSKQDLSDFLNGNADYMAQYRAELARRLGRYGEASVIIDRNALSDHITVNGESDEDGIVAYEMERMVNNWSWLNGR